MPQSQKQKNTRAALLMAVIIVCVAVASWFYLQQMGMGRSKGVYKNVTFTDALLECQSYTRERYGDSLKRLTFDAHSSRWEQAAGVYKLFFAADMAGRSAAPGDETSEFFIACDISGRSGKLRDYDALQNKAQKPEAQRMNDGGLFGWP